MSEPRDDRTLDPAANNPTIPPPQVTRPPTFPPPDSPPAQSAQTPTPTPVPHHPPFIGSYRILRVLGAGGMGVVYEAQQQHPRRPVALKVIGLSFLNDELLRRFSHEAQTLGRLKHPAIAQIYEAGMADGPHGSQPFFAMELVESGIPLDRYATQHSLDPRQRLDLLARICDAVQYAHQQGVVHRDLKPDNVLVTSDGQPKILDFGVARATDSDVQATVQTNVGQIVGTLAYMSPEQAAGNPDDVDTRSDIYSLGIIAYELLAGRRPYDLSRRTMPDAVRIIRDQEPTRLSNLDRSLRGDIETIVAKAIAKEKDRRYATAADFAADIRRFLHDEPIAARPPSTAYQFRKFARRNRVLVAGVAAVFLALIAGTIVSSILYVHAQRARVAEASQRQIAQARFDDVRKLAHTFIFDFSNALELGPTPARQLVVSTALEYLQRLEKDATSAQDAALQHEIASAYMAVADVQLHVAQNAKGGTDAAVQSGRSALAIFTSLAAAHPDDLAAQRDLAIAFNDYGDILHTAGNLNAAADQFRIRLDLLTRLSNRYPQNLQVTLDRIDALMLLGDAQWFMGNRDPGRALCRQAQQQAAALLPAHPDDFTVESRSMATDQYLADILYNENNFADALPVYQHSLSVCRHMLKQQPDSSPFRRNLALALQRIADTERGLGHPKDALPVLQEELRITEARAQADPADLDASLEQGYALMKLGTIQFAASQPADAIDSLRRANDMSRALYAADPTSSPLLTLFVSAADTLAESLLTVSRPADAAATLDQIVDLTHHFAAADPSDSEQQQAVLSLYIDLGNAHLAVATTTSANISATQNWQAAADSFTQAAVLARRMIDRGMTEATPKDLAEIRAALLKCQSAGAKIDPDAIVMTATTTSRPTTMR
jgi:serine/threonine protein kinase/tetratricopeptide (TPR) repeat protein